MAVTTSQSKGVAVNAVVNMGQRKIIMNRNFRSIILTAAWVALSALIVIPASATAQEETGIMQFVGEERPQSFDNSLALIDEFRKALAENDLAYLAGLLGLNAERLMTDEDTLTTFVKIRDGVAQQLILDEQGDEIILEIGEQLWPFPFPIVKDDNGTWSFDTYDGLEEIINRRVGRNELEAIDTARAYVDAQKEYTLQDHDGDGVLEYAQKLISTDGEADGLYWPASLVLGESPAGNFIDEDTLDLARLGEGYFGYHFRILTGQGKEIASGSYDYVINGNMIAGFALIAWPVDYAKTGAKTFMVSHHGTVYETDLGPETSAIVKYIDSFNPDDSWSVVTDGS